MRSTIPSRLAGIETQYILSSQIILDRLKHRSKIVTRMRVERGFRVANLEVTPARLFCQVAKALGWRTGRKSSITWREERKVNHVEGNAARARYVDDSC